MKKYVNADFIIEQIEELAEAYIDLIQDLNIESRQGQGTYKDKVRINCYVEFVEELDKLIEMFKLLKSLKGKEVK